MTNGSRQEREPPRFRMILDLPPVNQCLAEESMMTSRHAFGGEHANETATLLRSPMAPIQICYSVHQKRFTSYCKQVPCLELWCQSFRNSFKRKENPQSLPIACRQRGELCVNPCVGVGRYFVHALQLCKALHTAPGGESVHFPQRAETWGDASRGAVAEPVGTAWNRLKTTPIPCGSSAISSTQTPRSRS